MKKILMGSVVLSIAGLGIIGFQLSCTHQVVAQQTTNSLIQLNKIVFIKSVFQNGTTGSERTIWMLNLDGTGQVQVIPSPSLPPNTNILRARLTPDGTKIVYDVAISNHPNAGSATQTQNVIYSCNINGSNNAPILQGPQNQIPIVSGSTSFELMDLR